MQNQSGDGIIRAYLKGIAVQTGEIMRGVEGDDMIAALTALKAVEDEAERLLCTLARVKGGAR